MADGRVLLEVIVEGKNTRIVQRDVESVTDAVNQNTAAQRRNKKATDETAASHAHYDRGLKGASASSSNTTKNFSKMRDAMGGSSGLVGAYATLAANLFAATAAFSALQRAAQVEQLTQGLVALGQASGLAMMSLSKGLQESTGYAISLQDSMRSVAMVTSAGFDSSVIERLGEVAKNTSIALGRDLQDSMNRLVKGATKLEPELLDELGIMVRIDEATQKYAQQMGKSASSLTNFEKRQAFMNAVLEEGEKKFGAIGDQAGVNPYDRLSASLQELSVSGLNLINNVLGPLVNYLADNKAALISLFAIFGGSIAKQAFPYFSNLAAEAASSSLKIREAAREASKTSEERITSLKSELQPFEKTNAKWKENYNNIIQNASAEGDYQKAIDLVNKSIERRSNLPTGKVADPEEMAFLEAQRNILNEIIDAQKTASAGITTPKGSRSLAALEAEGTFLDKTSEVLDSLDQNPSLENFKNQWFEALEAGKQFRESMAGMESQVLGGLGRIIARIPFIGKAFATASVAVRSFGLAAQVALKGIFTAIPIIGQLIFIFDLLKSAVSAIIGFFKSDATKNNEEQITKLSESYKELADNSKEANKAFLGVSSTIVTQSQLVDAQFNILTTASKEFKDAFETSLRADDYEDLIEKTEELIDSNDALKRSFEERIKVELKGAELSELSEAQRARFLKKFLEDSTKAITAQKALNDAYKEAGDSLSKYFNSLTTGTPLDTVISSFLNLGKALEAARKEAKVTGEEFNEAKSLIENLGDSALGVMGLSSISTQFKEASKNAELFKNVSQGLPKLIGDISFFGDNAKVVEEANSFIEEFNKNLPEGGIPLPIVVDDFSPGGIIQQIQNVSKQAEKYGGLFSGAQEEADRLGAIIINRGKQSQANFAVIYEKMKDINGAQAALNTLTNQQSQYILLTTNQLNEKFDATKNLNNLQIASNDFLIKELSISAESEKDSLKKYQIQSAINNLTAQNAKLNTENLNIERDRAVNIAQNTLKNVQERVKFEQQIVSIMQEQVQLSSSILSSRQQLAETQLRIQNLLAGGDADLSASQQLKVLKQFEKDKIRNAEREYGLKIRAINLEEQLMRAQMAVSLAEIQKLIGEEEKRIYNGFSGEKRLYSQEEFDNLKQIAGVLRESTTGGLVQETANLKREEALVGKQLTLATDKEKTISTERLVTEESARAVESLAQLQLDILNAASSVQDKINSGRSSIIDSERTIRENELKAINLRNKGIGQYDLTAQQTLQLELEFGEQKKELLRQEEQTKLKLIDLEYKLLRAQLKVQEIDLISRLKTLRNQEGVDTTEIDKMISAVGPAFAEAAGLIPEAQRVATEELIFGTRASISEIEASQIQALQNVMGWTNKMTTSWKEVSTAIGQNFINTLEEAKSITQELADAFTNSVYAAVDAFVDAIVEGKNAFKAIGEALRTSLQESFAEAAKAKLKEGIAGIGSTIFSKIGGMFPGGKGLGEDVIKLMQGPQERAALAAENTSAGITETNKLLTQIAQNTAKCCSSAVMPSITPSSTFGPIEGFNSRIDSSGVYKSEGFTPTSDSNNIAGNWFEQQDKYNKKDFTIGGLQLEASDQTAINTKNTVGEIGFWGKSQEWATNNLSQVVTGGFAGLAAALAAGASPKKALLGGVLGSIGSIIGGTIGNMIAPGIGGAIGSQLGGAVGGGLSARGFASGGIMTSSGPMPLERYARGGVARTPQLAMFGEGSRPEAYVPLPDGRSIPVTMSNGGGNVNNISVNVAVEGGQAQVQASGGADNTEEYSRRLGTAISNAVKQEIFNQQRPGGLLYKGRR